MFADLSRFNNAMEKLDAAVTIPQSLDLTSYSSPETGTLYL